jgi:bacterioferritin-associated ferredoxin
MSNHSHSGVHDRVTKGGISMFVCLCTGATTEIVAEAVASGAFTSRQVAAACGAGADCGRCHHTLRAIITAGLERDAAATLRHGRPDSRSTDVGELIKAPG